MTRSLLAVALLACVGAVHAQTPAFDAAIVNDAATTEGPAAKLRAQVLLERAHFSPGELDGRGGTNTTRAIAAFQRSRNLEPTGKLDADTWAALNTDAPDALTTYTVVAEDLAGPFAPLPDDMMEQAALPALGYETIEEALAERFHSSPALIAALNPGVAFTGGAVLTVPNLVDRAALPKAARVVVDRSDSSLTLLDAAGLPFAHYPASTGSTHDPLPVGEWKVDSVATNPDFHYNPALFWDADPTHAKARLAPGPNNPVGSTWIDLSKDHYGIHGTPEPAQVGKTQSHGCIRLANWSVREVVQAVAAGMPVTLQE